MPFWNRIKRTRVFKNLPKNPASQNNFISYLYTPLIIPTKSNGKIKNAVMNMTQNAYLRKYFLSGATRFLYFLNLPFTNFPPNMPMPYPVISPIIAPVDATAAVKKGLRLSTAARTIINCPGSGKRTDALDIMLEMNTPI